MFEAYKIGIKIAVTENVTKTLLGMTNAFKGVEKEADVLMTKLDKLSKFKAIAGSMLLASAGIAAMIVGASIKPGSKYIDQLTKMNMAGMTHLDIVKSIQAAWATVTKVPTSSVTQNLAAIGNMRPVFGSTALSIAALPMIQKAQGVLQFTTGRNTDESYELARSLETRGATKNLKEFRIELDAMVKALIAAHGKLTPSDFMMTFKYGKTAAQKWSNDFTYTILPTLMQMFKSKSGSGSLAGTSMMSAFKAIIGGTISQKSLSTWHKLGLLNPRMEIFNKVGSLKGIEPDAITGSNEFMSDPFKWVQDVLRPALIKAGYKTANEQAKIIPYLFQNRNAGFAMGQMLLQPWKFTRDERLIKMAEPMKTAYSAMLKAPSVEWGALMTQFDTLMTNLGKRILPNTVPLMAKLVTILSAINQVLEGHLNKSVSSTIAGFVTSGLKSAAANLPVIGQSLGIIGNVVAPHKSLQTQSSGDVYLDSHKVGKVISGRMSHEATKHSNGTFFFDPSMSVPHKSQNFVGGF